MNEYIADLTLIPQTVLSYSEMSLLGVIHDRENKLIISKIFWRIGWSWFQSPHGNVNEDMADFTLIFLIFSYSLELFCSM